MASGFRSILSLAFSFAGAKVQISQALNDRVSLYYRETRLVHSDLAGG